jgi:hypothetical protein
MLYLNKSTIYSSIIKIRVSLLIVRNKKGSLIYCDIIGPLPILLTLILQGPNNNRIIEK